MNRGFSKSRVLAWHQCLRKLWLQTDYTELISVSADTEVHFRIGFEVGEQARALYPDGLLIETADPVEALSLTRQALQALREQPLFLVIYKNSCIRSPNKS